MGTGENGRVRKVCMGIAVFLFLGGIAELVQRQLALALFTWTVSVGALCLYLRARNEDTNRRLRSMVQQRRYEEARARVQVPPDSHIVCEGRFFLWLEQEAVHLFATSGEAGSLKERVIPVRDIFFHTSETERHPALAAFHASNEPIFISTGAPNGPSARIYYHAQGRNYALELAPADQSVLDRLLPEKTGCFLPNVSGG